jgi:hypothetical protein
MPRFTAVLMFALVAGPAHAQQAAPAAIHALADWAQQPTDQEIQAAKPSWVIGRGYAGLACDLGPGGALTACVVTSEQPADRGLGAAALGLAPRFRLPERLAASEGLKGAKVNVWLAWHGADGPCLPPICVGVPEAAITHR